MTPRFSCALNGVSPESIDPALRVTDVTELPPRRRVATVPTIRHGLRLLSRVRESLTVRISFVIPEYDPARRRALLQKLHAWADPGGVLTTSDRPGQQLQVMCDTLPMLSALAWSDVVQIDLTACEIPFWQQAEETCVLTGSEAVLTLPGDADETPVSCDVTNTGASTVTAVTLACGSTQMTFTGIALAPGSVLTVDASAAPLRCTIDGSSVLMHRTGESADLLLADSGAATPVSVSADGNVQAVFHARGRLL
ncbi:MAG: hypothetical protein IKK57_00790 [Clostridia bacterium]|nr:hypothetical protein [Clostridia bacterium]